LRLILSLGLLASAGCAMSSRTADIAAAVPDSIATAFVTPERATFVFPKETRTSFAWPASLADVDSDRFAWGITILTADTAFLPGGVVLRSDHPASISSFIELLQGVKPHLRYNPGGHALFTDDRVRVRMRPVAGRVVVELEGRDQVQRVFRARPSTVRFGVVAPTEPRWRQTITSVHYQTGWDEVQ
jgi:hypothetical protein